MSDWEKRFRERFPEIAADLLAHLRQSDWKEAVDAIGTKNAPQEVSGVSGVLRKPCCEKCYGRQGTQAGGGMYCTAKGECECHAPQKCCEKCLTNTSLCKCGSCHNTQCECHKKAPQGDRVEG